jgi:energy-coupling factor transporter ATP-binding protein EcfA2
MVAARKLNFPVLQRIRLSHFSLYTLKENIEFKISDGVLCLAGANGLGKSTFLQVVSYGMTGVVPKPGGKFVSVDDYYRDMRAFTREYFEGRLYPEDRDLAEIELEMTVGRKRITITRGFVESESLRDLQVVSGGVTTEYGDESPEQRHLTYEKLLTEEIGLGTFRELIFVQSFVMMFDERRHLLFWDSKVLETCLLIFMGVNKDQRAEVEQLRREGEKSASRVRNLSYDIKQTKDRLADLQSVLKKGKTSQRDTKTYEEYEELENRLKDADEGIALIEAKIRDTKLDIADSAARSSALRNEYNSEFANRLRAKQLSAQHPLVQQALLEGKCGVCGTDSPSVSEAIKAKFVAKVCPLCGSPLTLDGTGSKAMKRLMELDSALAREKKILDSKSTQVSQLEKERFNRTDERVKLQNELKSFEEKYHDVVAGPREDAKNLPELKRVYEEQIRTITRQRDVERDHGAKVNLKYRAAQKRLEQRYLDVREQFVPDFNSLAELFLGVDLDILLETGDNVALVLELKRTKRRSDHQLSESQRFFIDIALRMAFAKFASSNGSSASLYIDTPEGSLDLAYEAQAGQMIAKFANDGHRILMTANVNTSQLLRSIASNSKLGFAIQRLYRWTELSAIQEKNERKFDQTLNDVEKLAKASSR